MEEKAEWVHLCGPKSQFQRPSLHIAPPATQHDARHVVLHAAGSSPRAFSHAAAWPVACSTWREIRSPKPDQSKFKPAKFPNSSAELPASALLVTRTSPPAFKRNLCRTITQYQDSFALHLPDFQRRANPHQFHRHAWTRSHLHWAAGQAKYHRRQ